MESILSWSDENEGETKMKSVKMLNITLEGRLFRALCLLSGYIFISLVVLKNHF